jgi:hypothetical protein
MSSISLDFLIYLGKIRTQISSFVVDLITVLHKLGKKLNNPPLSGIRSSQLPNLIRRINC